MMIVDIVFLAFLALSILGATIWRTALWGLGAWGAVSVPLGVLVAGIAIVIFAWQAAARHHLPSPRKRRAGVWRAVIACVAAFVILWLFRARHDLWGERHAIATAIEHGMLRRPGAPLGTALNWLFYRFMNATFIWNGASSSALLSILAGTGFVAAAIGTAGLFSREDDGGGSGAALLVANGFAVVFFGAGGNAPLAALLALLFMYAALRFVRGEIHLIVPVILFPLAVFAQLPTVYLAPAFVYLFWYAYRSPETRRQVIPALVTLIACWAALEIVFAAALHGNGPSRYLISLSAGVIHARSNLIHRDVMTHLLTAANGFLILGPASAAALVLLLTRTTGRHAADERTRTEERLLALCAAPAILLFLAAAKRIDGGLRWDVFASTGPALALYTLCALRLRTVHAGTFRRATILLITLGVVHAVPLIVCSVHAGTAEKRLLSLPLELGRGSFIIAERAFENEEYQTAFDRYTAAIEQDQGNHMAYARLGTIYMKREEYIDAVTSYLAAVKRAPENREYRFLLSEAYIGKNWLEEAIDNLEQLTAAYPDSVRFWRRLGYARNHSNLYHEAIDAYKKALELEPDNDENVRNLTSAVLNRAAQLQKEEEYTEARALYEWAQQLYPTDWRAANNLAVMEMAMENIDKAYDILRTALLIHPFVPQLNLNMGLVLEKKGEDKAALSYLQKSAELDPLHSGAGPHIERLLGKLGQEE